MTRRDDAIPLRILASGCRTSLGAAGAAHRALLKGERGLRLQPFLGTEGDDEVPLALIPGRSLTEQAPPQWLALLVELGAEIPGEGWGGERSPVFVTSSNFGVGSLYAFTQTQRREFLTGCTPASSVEQVRTALGWGPNIVILSHACVSAHVGLLGATRVIQAGLADRALVFSFDFLSPFVTGGFHALKILNRGMPAPYVRGETGSIGLGDGAAFAVLTSDRGDFVIRAQSLYNEMQHFTANRADGSGFAACLAPQVEAAAGLRPWIKGHGTGTIEAGRLEAETVCRLFPGAPMVSWKGSIGHTLGSCGLVELALALESIRAGLAPGTVGSTAPFFADNVVADSFTTGTYDSVLLTSNAFGGAHAACLISHA